MFDLAIVLNTMLVHLLMCNDSYIIISTDNGDDERYTQGNKLKRSHLSQNRYCLLFLICNKYYRTTDTYQPNTGPIAQNKPPSIETVIDI
jgi:hypothetical protein